MKKMDLKMVANKCTNIPNHDTGSYDTLYEVDSSSSEVVIYWTMTGTHAIPDRQQYDEHTHQADMIPG